MLVAAAMQCSDLDCAGIREVFVGTTPVLSQEPLVLPPPALMGAPTAGSNSPIR
jgi:hypothetical protein